MTWPGILRVRFPYSLDAPRIRLPGPKRITAADIWAVCIGHNEQDVFEFSRLLVARDSDGALAAWSRLAILKEPPDKLLHIIAAQIRRILTTHQRSDGVLILETIARAQREMHRHPAGADMVFERLVLDILSPSPSS